MARKNCLIIFLALTLLITQMSIVIASIANNNEETIIRLDAKGGIPGKPGSEEPPTDPPAEPQQYELIVEIDYMPGHTPTKQVLDYIKWYYDGNNPTGDIIKITFLADYYEGNTFIDHFQSDEVEIDYSVSSEEFSTIENENNDNDNGYYSKYKWVLYGTTVENSPNTFGYASVTYTRKDVLAGNYIYIADQTADNWATTQELQIGAEAVVLMHELGHSIGIAKIHPAFGEQYDPDPNSVMSTISTANAGQTESWYYSDTYWNTNNLEYYTVSP